MSVDSSQFLMVSEAKGSKKLKPGDLFKAMVEKHEISKKEAKSAIRILIDSERLVYTYFNGTFVELPGVEGAAKPLEKS